MLTLDTPQIPSHPRHKRILIIEDESLMALMLNDMLIILGYDVAGTAPYLAEASNQIEHNSFDAAILDVNLCGKNTFDLADQLQKKDLPFIFSTGYDPASMPEKYRTRPALQKPYTMAQLSSHLETILGKAS